MKHFTHDQNSTRLIIKGPDAEMIAQLRCFARNGGAVLSRHQKAKLRAVKRLRKVFPEIPADHGLSLLIFE